MKKKLSHQSALIATLFYVGAANAAQSDQPRILVRLESPLVLKLSNAQAESRIGTISDVYLAPMGTKAYGQAKTWMVYRDDNQKSQWVDAHSLKSAAYPEGLTGKQPIELTFIDERTAKATQLEIAACPSEVDPRENWKGCAVLTMTGKGDTNATVPYFTAQVSAQPNSLEARTNPKDSNYVDLLAQMTDRNALIDLSQNLSLVVLSDRDRQSVATSDEQEWRRRQVANKKRLEEQERQLKAQYDAARAKLASVKPGTSIFCESGSTRVLSAGDRITSLAYRCDITGEQTWWNLRDLLDHGWTLSNQTRTPVDTWAGSVGYQVSLQLTKH